MKALALAKTKAYALRHSEEGELYTILVACAKTVLAQGTKEKK